MYTRAFVKNLILPSISVGVVRAEGKEDDCDNTRKLVRPRDLPLYVDPPQCVTCSNTVESEDGFLLTTIRCARQELQSVLEQAKVIQAEASSMLDNIKKETSDAVSYLQQEENLLPRMGAIGFGAFAGYILAVRKGILKKMLYSAAGAGAIAAVAYPNEAREYSEEVLCELKKYAVIGYHFVNGADVDWKKLNEKYRCFEKNGITGGSIEAGPRGKPGEVTGESAAVQKSRGKPVQGKPGGDTVTPQTKPGNTSEVAKTGDGSDGGLAKARSPQAGPGNASDGQKSNGEPCATPPEAPLPQDRPTNTNEPRPYKSYSDECKAKSACIKKPSDSSTKSGSSSNGSNGIQSNSSNAQDRRVSGDIRAKSNPDADQIQQNSGNGSTKRPLTAQPGGRIPDPNQRNVNGSTKRPYSAEPRGQIPDPKQPPMPSGRDAQEACIVGSSSNNREQSTNPNASPDYNQTQMEPQTGRLAAADARQSQMKSTGPPQSNDPGACIVPGGNTQRPRTAGSMRSYEPGPVEPNGPGSYAQRPRTAGKTSLARSQSVPHSWPSPPPYRPREIPESYSGNQRSPQSSGQGTSQSPCPMRPSSENGPTVSRVQERRHTQPVYEQRLPPESRNSWSNNSQSADEGSFQSSRSGCKDGCCMRRSKPKSVNVVPQVSEGEAPQIECRSPSDNGNPPATNPEETPM